MSDERIEQIRKTGKQSRQTVIDFCCALMRKNEQAQKKRNEQAQKKLIIEQLLEHAQKQKNNCNEE